MSYIVLTQEYYSVYLAHVEENLNNCRVYDPDLYNKVKTGLEEIPGIVIFAELDSDEKIIRSVMTKKRTSMYEYVIISIRSRTTFFNKDKFLKLFDFIFNYYEQEHYYKWILARPLDLLNARFFKNFYLEHPFSKYETAIEAHSSMKNFNSDYYRKLIEGTPESLEESNFVIISGFCKQQYRKFDDNISNSFV